MSPEHWIGKLVCKRQEESLVPFARVVWVEPSKPPTFFVYIEFPEKRSLSGNKTRVQAYIKAPIRKDVSWLEKQIDTGELEVISEKLPSELLLTDEELEGKKPDAGLNRLTRRKLKRWKDHRDAELNLIAPILKKHDPQRLFGRNQLANIARSHAQTLVRKSRAIEEGAKSSDSQTVQANPSPEHQTETLYHTQEKDTIAKKLIQTVLRYYLYGAIPNALLPRYFLCGGLGSIKFCKTQTGKPPIRGIPRKPRTEKTYKKMKDFYQSRKGKGETLKATRDAYLLLNCVAAISTPGQTDRSVELIPVEEQPSVGMIRRIADTLGHRNRPSQRNQGDRQYNNSHYKPRGTARTGVHAVGQLGSIDSTSEDHTPVACFSRHLHLPTPWRTPLKDVFSGYIFGVSRSFSHGSTQAALAAVHHAACDKIEWADRIGYKLKKRDWYSTSFRRIAGDNGDLKSERGILVLTAKEYSLEIVRSYTPRLKAAEAAHRAQHAGADHRLPGSNHGRIRKRGEEISEPLLTFDEGWKVCIDWILHYNNVERVPDQLTIDMKKDGVEPTRRGIVEWCLEKGLVSMGSDNLESLQVACMPQMVARAKSDHIQLLDPQYPHENREILKLRYRADFMGSDEWIRYCNRKGDHKLDIHVDPHAVGKACVNFNGLHSLTLIHDDPKRHSMTLFEWLLDAENTKNDKAIDDVLEVQPNRMAISKNLEQIVAKAKEEKSADLQLAAAPKTQSGGSKRANLKAEVAYMRQKELGLAPLIPEGHSPSLPADVDFVADLDAEWVEPNDDAMDRLRSTRR